MAEQIAPPIGPVKRGGGGTMAQFKADIILMQPLAMAVTAAPF